MEKIYMIEGIRQGQYFNNFIKAINEEEAIKKWKSAERFQDKIGKENFKKYQNITAKETKQNIPDNLIY